MIKFKNKLLAARDFKCLQAIFKAFMLKFMLKIKFTEEQRIRFHCFLLSHLMKQINFLSIINSRQKQFIQKSNLMQETHWETSMLKLS